MTTKTTLNLLTSEEREFFSLVSRAVMANPFTDERTELDLKISGLYPSVSYTRRLTRTIAEVTDRIDRFAVEGKADINLFSGQDRIWVENAFLFDVFHRFLGQFDQLIVDQNQAGTSSLKAPFAGDVLAMLRSRGFSETAAIRYFAIYFQVRRAFYFIDHSLVGRSPCMKNLRRKLWNNVFTHDIGIYNRYLWNRMEDFSTLILGETGTGKGTAAAAIGQSGYIPFDGKKGVFVESFPRTFVSLNLSQFPETIIESELFGHKKGAFTGAVEDHQGMFGRCSPHGSIFLDEIGEVSKPIQVKLLQVIEERSFSPVGSHETRRFRGRVIAATNRTLEELRSKELMRDDFYYRLCSDVITVPSLRQRIFEDPLELDDLLNLKVARILGETSPEMVEKIRKGIEIHLGPDYNWPGNVRELEQCIRRMLLDQTYAGPPRFMEDDPACRLKQGIETGTMDAQELLTTYCRLLYQRHGTFEAVAKQTRLDRRTVKKYIETQHLNNTLGN
jgi:DNA-binding NtrC family response regulator